MKKCVISLSDGYGLRGLSKNPLQKLRVISHLHKFLGEKNVLRCEKLEQLGYKHCGLAAKIRYFT